MNTDEFEYECSECGTTVLPQDKVCKNCGANLEEITTSLEQPSQHSPAVSTTSDRLIALPPFESATSRVKWVNLFLIICILFDLVAIVSTYSQIELLSGVKQGHSITIEAAEANDSRQQSIGILQILVFIITSIFFLVWIHRAHHNLPALGATGLKYSPGWAVGGFFVPFLNLVRPFQVMTEIWKASDPAISVGSSWQDGPSSPIIGQWWGAHLASGAIGWFSFRSASEAGTIDSLLNTSWILLIADIATIVAALLAMRMIKAINARQELKYRSLITNTQTVMNSNVRNGA